MKKQIFIFVIFLFYISPTTAQILKNDLVQPEQLNGKVMTIAETSSKAIFGKRSKFTNWKKTDSTAKIFNEKGNKIEQNSYNSDGSLAKKLTYKYDDKKNIIETNEYKSTGELVLKETYKYDDQGNKIEQNSHKSDSIFTLKYSYKYNDKGNKIEQISYQPQRIEEKVSSQKYDDNGHLIESYTYGPYNMLLSGYTYKYDDKDNLIETKLYIIDMQNMSSEQILDMTLTGKTPPLTLSSSDTFKYDYDTKLNWIKKTTLDNKGVATNIVERTIVYF